MIPFWRRQSVPTDEVFAIFAAAPVIDGAELRANLDADFDQDVRDPYEGTGL
jgi:hypothetical protein